MTGLVLMRLYESPQLGELFCLKDVCLFVLFIYFMQIEVRGQPVCLCPLILLADTLLGIHELIRCTAAYDDENNN